MNFEYRLIISTCYNRIERESGPWSVEDIVSDISEKTMKVWKDKDESFGEKLLREGDPTLYLISEDDDGWIQFSYNLERRTSNTEWKYIGRLESNRINKMNDEYPEIWEEQQTYCRNCGVLSHLSICKVCIEIEDEE